MRSREVVLQLRGTACSLALCLSGRQSLPVEARSSGPCNEGGSFPFRSTGRVVRIRRAVSRTHSTTFDSLDYTLPLIMLNVTGSDDPGPRDRYMYKIKKKTGKMKRPVAATSGVRLLKVQ